MMKMMAWILSLTIIGTAFAGPLDDAWIRGTTDRDPLGYAPGDEMVFTLTPMGLTNEVPSGVYFLNWKRSDDFGGVETGRVAFTGAPFVYRTSLGRPGFVRLEAFVVDRDGKRYRKQPTKQDVFFDGGAGVEPEKLVGYPEPTDFDAFWRNQFRRLESVPMKVDVVEIPCSNAAVRMSAVRIDCAGLRPVTGYLQVPKAVDEGKIFPCRLETHGYSSTRCVHQRPDRRWLRTNEIVLNINAHGLKLVEFGATEADTKALRWEIGSNGRNYAFDEKQNADPEVAYFNGMVLRVKRALQYLKTVKGWNGTDLIASGGSQGGLQTIWAAGCGEGVTRAESGITWCCDMARNNLRRERKASSDGWYVPWTESMGYYDAVNFAKRIPLSCRTVITRAGLGDYCCPPMGLAKLYNGIPGNKEIRWMQGSQHGYQPPAYEGRDFRREQFGREPLRVTLTFDDALKDHLLIAAPELEKRGWRGTFNLVTDWVGSKPKMLTWADARELVRRGHELTTHSKTHPNMLKLSETQIRTELALSRDVITDCTGFAPRYYCAPYLQQNEETARLARLEGLEQMPGPRHNYCAKSPSVRDQLLAAYERGVKRYDILHHGICPVEAGGHGGWEPFADKAAFLAHLDAIAELEREGKIVVTDYDGFLSNCRLAAKAWPHHGVIALSFDDHNLADWEAAFPLFAKFGAKATFFLVGAFGTNEVAFARKAMLAGHEIGLHGLCHRNADSEIEKSGTAAYWREEIAPQLDACRAAGLRPRSFAYPNCRRSPEADELFRTNGFTRVRGLSDGIPCPTPHDPKNEKASLRHPVAESDSEFFPVAGYLSVFRIRNVIMGSFYHTDIEDYIRAMRRAGERAEVLSVVSHGIKPEPNGISMRTEWLERLLAEADEAGVVIRGVR